ncbi:hypothetical protein [Oceanobacillus kimchii]|uniref:hypothetical protein n=1 Tax=Oceanobacillus kimchii TaxID=746691 RepID=UPI003C74C296
MSNIQDLENMIQKVESIRSENIEVLQDLLKKKSGRYGKLSDTFMDGIYTMQKKWYL